MNPISFEVFKKSQGTQPVHGLGSVNVPPVLVQQQAVVVEGVDVIGVPFQRPLVHILHHIQVPLAEDASSSSYFSTQELTSHKFRENMSLKPAPSPT